jgi:hypothetical protein
VCQLFDALVKPVLSYGCELWVDEPATKSLVAIHRSFLKSLLGVNDTTPSRIEFGRFPLILFWRQQALKYKARMSTSLPSRLMSLAYSVQQALSSKQKCWLRKLQNWDSEGDTQPSSQVPPSMASMQQIFLDSSGGAIGLQTTSDCMAAAPMVFKHTLALWTMYSSESAFHASVVLTTTWRLKPAAGPSP